MTSTDKQIKKLVGGTGIIAVGSVVGKFIQLLGGLLLVRVIDPREYGLYTLAFAIISIAVLLADFGMRNSLTQFTSKYRATQEHGNIWGCIFFAVIIVGVLSLCFSTSIYFFSGFISGLFRKPELVPFLRFFVVLIPCMSFLLILLGIFRGLCNAWPKMIFEDLSPRLLKVIGLLFVLSMGYGLKGVLWVTVIPTFLVFFALIFYAYKSIPKIIPYKRPAWGETSKLVRFSLPLYGNNIVGLVSFRASTLLLGYYVASDMIALHKVALTIAQLLELPLVSMAFLYLPISTSLYSIQNLHQTKELYKSSTKWIALVSMPIFLFILFDAEFIVVTLFGEGYLPATNALRILSFGFFIHTALGPNGMTLLSVGRPNMVLIASLFGLVFSLSLYILLIPQWNITGAVIAASIGRVVSNLFLSISLYYRTGIHPFSRNYLKVFGAISIVAILLNYLLNLQPTSNIVVHIMLLCGLFLFCICAPFVTKSVDSSDIAIISAIENKLFRRALISDKLANWNGLESVG